MNKQTKTIIVIIAIIVALITIIFVVDKMFKAEPMNAEPSQNILEDPDKGLENMINDILDNSIGEENVVNEEQNNVGENDIQNDKKTENNTSNNNNTSTGSSNKVNDPDNETTLTPKEQRAIELAKKEWGEASGVYFNNEGIQSDGKYVVSVRETSSTKIIVYYIVDVENKIVKER